MRMRVGIPKLFWWIRYQVGGGYGVFPRAYRTQSEAQDEAIRKLGGSYVRYEIFPLETRDSHVAARKLKAMINKDGGTNRISTSSYNPLSDMRY
jgi:hypothetical protein